MCCQLTPTIGLSDLPHVIPVLRMQQSMLDFTCDVTAVPRRSPFMPAMQKMIKVALLFSRPPACVPAWLRPAWLPACGGGGDGLGSLRR